MAKNILILFAGLLMSSCASKKTPSITENEIFKNDWKLTQIQHKKITQKNAPTLSFAVEKGRFYGFAGCNQISGSVQKTDFNINFKNIASTFMRCDDPQMQIESEYISFLQQVSSFRIEKNQLFLLDSNQDNLLIFSIIQKNRQ